MSDNYYYGYNYGQSVIGRMAACSCQRICYECNNISPPFHFFNTLLAQYYANISLIRPEFELDVDDMINSVELPQNNNTRNRRRKPFAIFCLPHGDLSPKIPRKIEKLREKDLIQYTFFDSNNGVINEVERLFPFLKNRRWRFFRTRTTSNLEIASQPSSGWSIKELMRICGFRKKLYIGTIDGQIQQFLPL
ncbi:unnamed protein product [Rhizophagus irregularis]|nr:unnamed protein product [Rhizophagus irregularis]CAB5359530.1 unnamed protein product [Rhizophagus irregularis]